MIRFLLPFLAMASLSASQEPAQTLASRLDPIVQEAVRSGLIPGAVLAVGHGSGIVYRQAYGFRSLVPTKQAMTLDTIFDVASLTKVVATTPCLMKLFEEGKLRIDDPVTKYLPEFLGGKSDITIRLLMTHFSGFQPDFELGPHWNGYETGLQKAFAEKPIAPPGARFIYSDTNFILLGEIVRRLSGMSLAEYAKQTVFQPLGMTETGFLPEPSLRSRIAPTEKDPETGIPLLGVVHDPRSRYMGGVAGHAGLFSTVDDLAKYASMMLAMGEAGGQHVFSRLAVKKFTEPATPADQPVLRGLGWDIDSPYSSNRGELFPIGSYGHTGYTGTSLWIDATTNSFVILLTNVVHPNGIKSLSSLRSRVATAVAANFGQTVPRRVALTGYNETITGAGVHRVVARNGVTLTGLDVLEETGFKELQGKRVGLITNHTGVDRSGKRNVDLMLSAGVNVSRLFSPEHGIAGTEDEDVADTSDPGTHIPVTSLYEPDRRRLTAAQMKDLDAVVYDIQDVGARFYTYSCTLLYAVEEAGKAGKPFWILDRPNPLTGTHVEGPIMETNLHSFVGCYNIPTRYGMTFGELATMANQEQHWNADLHVVRLRNWERGDWFDSTSLTWINPSPNMRSLDAAMLYPGVAILEADSNLSVGRGTDDPFEQIGAPWIDGPALASYLNGRFIPGVRIYPTRFRPTSSNFAGTTVPGVRFILTDREMFDSSRFGVELASALEKLFPGKIEFEKCRFLIGNRSVLESLKKGQDPSAIWMRLQSGAADFANRRKPYLLY
ncbi:MAG: exo-beta-N-acetylmuramidase NamZ domain-containing protein [Bryobacteraceae bacterium]